MYSASCLLACSRSVQSTGGGCPLQAAPSWESVRPYSTPVLVWLVLKGDGSILVQQTHRGDFSRPEIKWGSAEAKPLRVVSYLIESHRVQSYQVACHLNRTHSDYRRRAFGVNTILRRLHHSLNLATRGDDIKRARFPNQPGHDFSASRQFHGCCGPGRRSRTGFCGDGLLQILQRNFQSLIHSLLEEFQSSHREVGGDCPERVQTCYFGNFRARSLTVQSD